MLLTKEKYAQFSVFCFLSSYHMSALYLSRHHAMTLPFRHIPKNNLRNTLSLILYWRLETKISLSKKEDFLFKTRKFDCKAQIICEKFYFFREKGSSTHVETERIRFNKSDMRYNCPKFLLHSPLFYLNDDLWKVVLFSVIQVTLSCLRFFFLSEMLVWSKKANTLPAPSCLFIHIMWINFKKEKLG